MTGAGIDAILPVDVGRIICSRIIEERIFGMVPAGFRVAMKWVGDFSREWLVPVLQVDPRIHGFALALKIAVGILAP